MNSLIQTPTPDLAKSIAFYQRLNFQQLAAEHPNVLSDGKALIEINADRFARAGIKLYAASWEKYLIPLKKLVKVHTIEGGFLFSDPSGTWVYLMEASAPVAFKAAEASSSVLGNYMGLSLETPDMDKSAQLFEILDFKAVMGSAEQGWVVFQNADGLGISLMKPMSCPHLFFNPSLTYFNGQNNLAVIEKIRALDIPITEEITHFNEENKVDNIIIRDPGGLGFFLFSDG